MMLSMLFSLNGASTCWKVKGLLTFQLLEALNTAKT